VGLVGADAGLPRPVAGAGGGCRAGLGGLGAEQYLGTIPFSGSPPVFPTRKGLECREITLRER